MPFISIILNDDHLASAAVARAVANLALALGGHVGDQATAASTPVDVADYVAASTAHSVDQPTPAAAAQLVGTSGGAVRNALPADRMDNALRTRWDGYVAGLTEGPRRFLALLERNGRLTIVETIEKLGLPGKAVGGIVGGISRWTPQRGFALPYTTHENANGVRYWVWTGVAAG